METTSMELPELALAVVKRYHHELVRYAGKILGNWDDGEDVVQETYFKRRLHELLLSDLTFVSHDGTLTPMCKAYYMRAVKTSCRTIQRRKAGRLRLLHALFHEGREHSHQVLPEDQAIQGEDAEALHAAIEAVPDEKVKAFILLYYFEDKSDREIAKGCSIPENKISHIRVERARGLTQIRQWLKQRGLCVRFVR